MNYLKKVAVSLLYTIAIFLSLTLITTLFNYINIINYKVMIIIKILIPIISLIIGSIVLGKRSVKKGWLEGLKLGLIILFLLFLFNLLAFNDGLELKDLIFYLIILASTILGSMIGISKQKES